jgi:alkaline phosphatase
MNRLQKSLLCALLAVPVWGASKARNVVLFLGDAGGIPTLNAGSIQAYGEPTKLYVQHMPHVALSETSASNNWVTDSAAGMTAIVTGHKTKNGVLSEMPTDGDGDGSPLKTILEYAEEHGLSTGVISNSPMYDATPAACYAHVSSRKKTGEIFEQIWKPRFGDGVDLVLGPGRTAVLKSLAEMHLDLRSELEKRGYFYGNSMNDLPANARRAVVITDEGDFDISSATRAAIAILSRNPKGYFLMVESDLHTDNIRRGLERVPKFDHLIEETAEATRKDTLVLFTADHSFDLRTVGSLPKGSALYAPDGTGKVLPAKGVTVEGHHSGEPVLVAAEGPGAERVHGFLVNTDLFQIMLDAWGWRMEMSSTR